jgi:hypothetical protein
MNPTKLIDQIIDEAEESINTIADFQQWCDDNDCVVSIKRTPRLGWEVTLSTVVAQQYKPVGHGTGTDLLGAIANAIDTFHTVSSKS